MASRPPLFSRRQLNILIMVTGVVIALLSIPSEPWPQIERVQIQQVPLSTISSDDHPAELRLSFALPRPALLPTAPEQILWQLLKQRLEQATTAFQVSLYRDRISIAVTASPSGELLEALQQLPPLLTEVFTEEALNHGIDKLRAQRYLQRNNPAPLEAADRWVRQQQADDSLANALTPTAITRLQQQLFSRAQLRISLVSLAQEPIIAALNNTLQQFNSELTWDENPQPKSISATTIAGDLSPVVALQTLPGRASSDFPGTLLLSRILADLGPELTIRLHPNKDQSWLVWLTTTPNAQYDISGQIQRMQQRLAELKDWELERAADDLRELLQQRLQEPEALAEQLEVIAFYQLPVDYLTQFEATIAALSRTEIRQQLQHLLQPANFSYPKANALNP